MSNLEKQQRKLARQIRAINRTGVADLTKALQVLNSVAAPAPKDLPTRQQRRAAARRAAKAQP